MKRNKSIKSETSRNTRRWMTTLTLCALLMPLAAQAQNNSGGNMPTNTFTPGGNSASGYGGNNQNSGGSNAAYNGFNPVTGTWSTGGNSSSPALNPTNGFNAQAGTWAGSTSSATGGSWSAGTGSNGGSINMFTPNQTVSGSNASSNFGSSASANRLSSGPKVIPHVSVRPRLPIYNRVPIRNRF